MAATVLLVAVAGVLAVVASRIDGRRSVRDEVTNRTFVSTRVDGWQLVPGTRLQVAFDDEVVSFSAGCNSTSAPWDVRDGRLLPTGDVLSTLIGCTEPLAAQDAWTRTFVEGGPQLALDGLVLRLELDGQQIELVETTAVTAGEAAIWSVDATGISSTSQTFVAQVMRLGCSGGVTGDVLPPRVELHDTDIVVTFEVAPLPPGNYGCPGNDTVPYEVLVGEPIGDHRLIDGSCAPGGEATPTNLCSDGGARWSP